MANTTPEPVRFTTERYQSGKRAMVFVDDILMGHLGSYPAALDAFEAMVDSHDGVVVAGEKLEDALHGYLQGDDPNKAAILSAAIDRHRAALSAARPDTSAL